ncbi:FkbM family methyltransferase [Candidatus Hydrogenedentota bacterium]
MSKPQHTEKHDDLIYDVGMHKGEDTDYYIKKGFRVIGFEADPELVEQCRARFAAEIENDRLTVVEGAIVESPPGGSGNRTVKFYKNRDNRIWSTVSGEWARRKESFGTSNEEIEVPVVNFPECLAKYGIPHYLKIDIEGMDLLCLEALSDSEQKPDYVSIESEKVSFESLIRELDLLSQLGYREFKAIQQKSVWRRKEPRESSEGRHVGYQFQEGSSGLFGSDLPRKWKNYEQVVKEYRLIFLQYKLFGDYGTLSKHFAGRFLGNAISFLLHRPIPGWYDTHAKHSSVIS